MKSNSEQLFQKLDDLVTYFKKHEQEITMLANQVRNLEERVAKLEVGRK